MAASKQKSTNTDEAGDITAVSDSIPMETVKPLLNLDEYLAITEINPGLIASFKVETLNNTETPRTAEQWCTDFNIQSNRAYI